MGGFGWATREETGPNDASGALFGPQVCVSFNINVFIYLFPFYYYKTPARTHPHPPYLQMRAGGGFFHYLITHPLACKHKPGWLYSPPPPPHPPRSQTRAGGGVFFINQQQHQQLPFLSATSPNNGENGPKQ